MKRNEAPITRRVDLGAGELVGARLTLIPHTVVFWFAWAAFRPEYGLSQPAG